MKNIILKLIVTFIIIDFSGFILWALSGQFPITDGYYFGQVTRELLKLIII